MYTNDDSLEMSPILGTDSYKFTHFKQYPPGTEFVRSYLEPRIGGAYKKVLSFGALNYFVRTVLARPISRIEIDEAEDFVAMHLGSKAHFNRKGWEHILIAHDGFLPVRLRAVPEGLFIPVSNVLLTLENTDPHVPWLTNYLETRMSHVWYPYTVATLSNHCRQIILGFLRATGTPADIEFKLHDFGFRGVSSDESAGIGGLAHMVNFKGSDTAPAFLAARRFYGCSMAGFSIPAAEHSTITTWKRNHEVDAYDNMLNQYPTGPVAVVSDSYSITDACEKLWGETLREKVLARDGVLIIRPDSGHPPEVVMKCLRILALKFGSSLNHKGYRVLNDKVRLIQGDGVDPQMIDMVLSVMQVNGYSADNIAFGMGGALLQKVNRDTCRFAFKCCGIRVKGEDYGVYKSPASGHDKTSKQSMTGLGLSLYAQPNQNGEPYYYTAEAGGSPSGTDVMKTFYEDGRIVFSESLDTIRERVRSVENTRYEAVQTLRVTTIKHQENCAAQHDDAEATCQCGVN